MKENLKKIFSLELLAIILLGGALFGFLKYVDYRFNILENKIVDSDNKITVLEKNYKDKFGNFDQVVLDAQNNLENIVKQEKEKSSYLEDQFGEISNTVSALSKLSATDPELLKKYSKVYFLNEHYIPVSLSDIGTDFRSVKSTNYQILTDVLPHLEKMITDSNTDGLGLRALSAYRSFATQSALKSNYKVTYGTGANKFSADQGYSEHQLGTAIDFTTEGTKGALTGFDKTKEYEWMNNNSYKYGFIISYPAGNKYYVFEPWHWRFVGVELATKLHDENKYFYNEDQRVIDSYLAKIFD